MPHALWQLQGERRAKFVEVKDRARPDQDDASLRRLRADHARHARRAPVRRGGRRPGRVPAMDGRAGAGNARSHRRRRARLPRPAHPDHLAPQRGVLENRPLDLPPPREAARPSGEAGDVPASPSAFFASLGVLDHDGALFRNHRPLLAPLPLRALRKGHGLRDPRRRPVRQARRHRADEPVQRGADPGRARPHPVRVAHHQRVHRRALPASAADAGRSGRAGAGAGSSSSISRRSCSPTSTSSKAAASREPTSSSRRRARRSAIA